MTPAAKSRLARPSVILPLMMFLGVLIVGVRAGDMWDSVTSGKIFQAVSPAHAAASETQNNKASDTQASKPQDAKPPETQPAAVAPSPPATEAKPADTPLPPSQSGASDDSSNQEMDLVKQLSNRRDQLEKRSHDLDTREALIHVAEQRVDQKIKEMEKLRAQLQTLINQGNAAQQAQLDNLVKIYETMKPQEAAKIFETLEMPVLLGVVQKMKPQRTASIMAAMNPEKAKEITVALTKQDQLPQVK